MSSAYDVNSHDFHENTMNIEKNRQFNDSGANIQCHKFKKKKKKEAGMIMVVARGWLDTKWLKCTTF